MAEEELQGYCVEPVCAHLLAGMGEESTPEEILMVIACLAHLLLGGYPAGRIGAGDGEERYPCRRE